jgi:transcriptional regulator with XRE-family HTH domain
MTRGTAEDRERGRTLRGARLDRKLTQAKLARRLGVDAKTISLIERGLLRQPTSFFSRAARILHVSVFRFLGDGG